MRTLVIGAAIVVGVLASVQGQAPAPAACLHGPQETPEEAARRRTAVTLARRINTLQNAAFQQDRRYRPLTELPEVSSPVDGFAVRLAADDASYVFAVKDTLDPCRFAFFSDQEGLIYSAEPLR